MKMRATALAALPYCFPKSSRRVLALSTKHRSVRGLDRMKRRRVLVDTDAGFDDLVALQCLLAHGHNIDLVTTVCGSNTSSVTCASFRRLFPHLDVVASADRPRPSQAWLKDFRRRFGDFVERHGVAAPTQGQVPCTQDITVRVKQFLESSPDDSVDLICLGPLSNVANWIGRFPKLFESKVTHVWILGGSHPNTGRADEFNFGQDAPAAAGVLRELAEKVYLVPGDATSHTLVPDEYIRAIVEAARQHLADDVNNNILAHVVQEEQLYSIFYDPVCVFLYLHPEAARFPREPLQVNPESGVAESGRTDGVAIPIAERVDFDAYQSWLLRAIRQDSPTCTGAQRSTGQDEDEDGD